jgi:hypothetical protein
MKFKLILHKEFDIDTDRDWNGELGSLIDALKNNIGVEPGNTATHKEIADAIEVMLADDIEYVVTLDLDETNFSIEVPPGATVEVPAEEDEEE